MDQMAANQQAAFNQQQQQEEQPIPLSTINELETKPLQEHLDDDLLERLGLQNEIFPSGTYALAQSQKVQAAGGIQVKPMGEAE